MNLLLSGTTIRVEYDSATFSIEVGSITAFTNDGLKYYIAYNLEETEYSLVIGYSSIEQFNEGAVPGFDELVTIITNFIADPTSIVSVVTVQQVADQQVREDIETISEEGITIKDLYLAFKQVANYLARPLWLDVTGVMKVTGPVTVSSGSINVGTVTTVTSMSQMGGYPVDGYAMWRTNWVLNVRRNIT